MLRVEEEEEEPGTAGVDEAAAVCEKAPRVVGEDGESEDDDDVGSGSGGKMGRLRSAVERTMSPPRPPPSGGEGDKSICDGFRIWEGKGGRGIKECEGKKPPRACSHTQNLNGEECHCTDVHHTHARVHTPEENCQDAGQLMSPYCRCHRSLRRR